MRSLLIGHSILAGEVSGECGGIVKNCYGELFTRRDKEVLRGLHCTAYDEELLRRGGRGVRPYTGLLLLGLLWWRLGSGLVCRQIFARSHIWRVGHARDLATGSIVDADARVV